MELALWPHFLSRLVLCPRHSLLPEIVLVGRLRSSTPRSDSAELDGQILAHNAALCFMGKKRVVSEID